jgi:rhamnose transport system ATP-binding protein
VGQTILEMRGISKFFPGIKALEGVDFSMRSGEVHALIGENGAGKSTLVKVLTGVHRPSSGTISLGGIRKEFHNPLDARKAGIAAIHQEASMFPDLSVTENVFSGHFRRGRASILDWRSMRERTRALLERVELDVSPDALVRELSVAQRHLVGIARALSEDASIVIMDEPTSALSLRETEDLFKIIRALRSEGKAILFISHKFDEILEIADYYTVLRDGAYVGEGKIADATIDSLVHMMVGRDLAELFPARDSKPGSTLLSVEGFSRAGFYKDVSFGLREGEILGMFGLVGSGRTDVILSLLGLEPKDSGKVVLKGSEVRISGPRDALELGIAHVPEDRQSQGVILDMGIGDNITLPQAGSLSTASFLDPAAEREIARSYGTRMEIKAGSWEDDAKTLSGGNQQKVVLAKWLATKPSILILDEPTKGIDVGTKAAVHAFMAKLASEGMSIIMISSELPEILGMSDRILVMYEGRIAASLDRRDADEATIMRAATGVATRDASRGEAATGVASRGEAARDAGGGEAVQAEGRARK